MKIKGILFDLDGTLVDTNNLILTTFDYTLEKCLGKTLPREEIIKYFGRPLRDAMKVYAPGREDELCEVYREYNIANHDKLIKPFPNVKETLQELKKRNIKMAVVTSKKAETAMRGLKCFGLEEYIEGIVGCYDVENTKPHPEPSVKGLEMLGLDGAECLIVGDSPFDLQSGRGAGCTTVAVGYSSFDKETMEELAQPEYTINSMDELLTVINNIEDK